MIPRDPIWPMLEEVGILEIGALRASHEEWRFLAARALGVAGPPPNAPRALSLWRAVAALGVVQLEVHRDHDGWAARLRLATRETYAAPLATPELALCAALRVQSDYLAGTVNWATRVSEFHDQLRRAAP